MTYCLDTDVISAAIKPEPPLHLIRRAAAVPAAEQATTAITVGELLYGAKRRGSARLTTLVQQVVDGLAVVLPFDSAAAATYGDVRAGLERDGRPLAEPDLRIASIALTHDLVLVTGNVRHFARVPGLVVENWLEPLPPHP